MGRKVDIKDLIEYVRNEGYESFQVSEEFIIEFSGLTVTHPHYGEKLTPIGKAFRGYMILTMSVTGKVYAGYDDCLLKIGDSGYEALNTLCEGIESNMVRIEYKSNN